MHLDAYTDDVICNAMGLGQFEPVAIERAIRLLVKPSFHPEACVTIEPTRLHAVTLRSMLRHEPVPSRLPEYGEATSLTGDQFQRVVEAFDRALVEHANAGKCVTIDGMPISALRIAGDQRSAFEGQPVGSEQARFVAGVLRLAHASVSSVHLRNRIAECGRYVDRTFTIESEPELPNVTRVMVLGAPDERAEYFEKLQARTAPRPSA